MGTMTTPSRMASGRGSRTGPRAGLLLILLALAVGLGAWGGGPGPAAAAEKRSPIVRRFPPPPERYTTARAAYGRVDLGITGANIVRSFTGTTHTITVTNDNPYALPAVRLIVSHRDLPIDFHELRELSDLGFSCLVLDGLALDGATAECSGNQLGAGEALRLRLTGGTTLVMGEGEGLLHVELFANYPQEENSSLVNNYAVAINPN
jgi:hypothetical protein